MPVYKITVEYTARAETLVEVPADISTREQIEEYVNSGKSANESNVKLAELCTEVIYKSPLFLLDAERVQE